jgi:hypothetical protein
LKVLLPLFLFFLLLPFGGFAQITIETVTTDTVDLFNNKQLNTPRYYSKGALWSTLLIPGSGHQIVGKNKRALGYITFDLLSLFGALYFNQFSNKLISNYQSYASNYAGIKESINNDFYWEVIGSFDNYYDFQETMDLVREKDKRFVEEKYFWMWEDSLFRAEYVTMQKKAKRIRMVSSFFIGAMILNRIVAFIDLRSTLKNNRFSKVSTLSFRPYFSKSSANGLVLSSDF